MSLPISRRGELKVGCFMMFKHFLQGGSGMKTLILMCWIYLYVNQITMKIYDD